MRETKICGDHFLNGSNLWVLSIVSCVSHFKVLERGETATICLEGEQFQLGNSFSV